MLTTFVLFHFLHGNIQSGTPSAMVAQKFSPSIHVRRYSPSNTLASMKSRLLSPQLISSFLVFLFATIRGIYEVSWHKLFYRVRLLASRPTPNLEDQGIPVFGPSSLTCPAWEETLSIVMLPPALPSGYFDHISHTTASEQGYHQGHIKSDGLGADELLVELTEVVNDDTSKLVRISRKPTASALNNTYSDVTQQPKFST